MRPAETSALYNPLEHIIGSPGLVRVARVLAQHGGSLGVSDISRRAKLSLPSTRAALRRLRESEIVTGVGAGRSMVCSLRMEHPLTPALVALFSAEEKYANVVLGAIRRAVRSLKPPPLAVWLYGSVARAADTPTSDVDVAIVSASAEPAAQADALRDGISIELGEEDHRVSVIALGPRDVARLARTKSKFWSELRRDAVVLAGDAPDGLLQQLRRKPTKR
jgi:predicted nucleotidyltransferase